MLVLSRAEAEGIRFRDLGIQVKVLKLSGNRVRLGIDAPRDVAIIRDELCDEIVDTIDNDSSKQPNALQEAIRHSSVLKQLVQNAGCRRSKETVELLNASLGRLNRDGRRQENRRQSSSLQKATSRGMQTGLIVDDNPNESTLLASYLRLEHFDVKTVNDGEQALERLNNHAFDFVLLDMNMPVHDGNWTLSKIRSNDELKNLDVFAVSGSSPAKHGIPIGPSGCNAWFQKPVDPVQIVSEIRERVGSTTIS
ncbi:MAG: response regulator [Aureliella sp.]